MERGQVCCFVGHRDVPARKMEYIRRELMREIGEVVADGGEHFLSGFDEGVDRLAASVVLELQKDWPGLVLDAVLPSCDRLEELTGREDTRAMLRACSSVHTEADGPSDLETRNRRKLERSGRMIAVYDGREAGNTVEAMRLARSMGREVRVIRLLEWEDIPKLGI